MRARDIRQSFLDFFRERGHTIVESAPVIPPDPTLLFTNSGMNQFKDVFLGTGQRPYKRAADTQKCIRAGGKHNDLEVVGKDGYHQTFFEMLGNWSFGDYFKAEAIEWAWDLLTRVWGIDRARLYATVHRSDDEAAELWPKVAGIARDRVLRFGDRDNFWEMGNTGPCGPCTEIHIDRGAGTCDRQDVPGHVCAVNAGCSRFIELWNLVFIQFERKPDRSLETLPAKHVDTGMGLERVTQVLQGVQSNYDTDLLKPLVDAVAKRTGVAYDRGPAGTPHRAIADHVRALSFAIADGVTPGATKRGYTLRSILRRAARFFHKLGIQSEPAIKDLVPVLSGTMGDAFPELRVRQAHVVRVIEAEELRFLETLDRGVAEFEAERKRLVDAGRALVPGDVVFYLKSTHGFPEDLTQQMAEEAGLRTDLEGFRRLEEEHKQQSGTAHFQVDLGRYKHAPVTAFTGYQSVQETAAVVQASDHELVLDRTPFYAQAGGQVGDTGRIVAVAEGGASGLEFDVQDVQKTGQVTVHLGEWVQGDAAAARSGTAVLAAVDAARREAIKRNHTATHLLHWALREVLGPGAQQQGSEVSPTRLRFDFAWGKRVGPEELMEIERAVNEKVVQNVPLACKEMAIGDARDLGAIALFGEKYGDWVRVIDIGGFSVELCGGTHVARTGDIGTFKVVQESSVSEGVRRVAALTGGAAVARAYQDARLLAQLTADLKVRPEELAERIRRLQDELKDLEKKNRAALQRALPTWDELKGRAKGVGDVKLLALEVEGANADALRQFGDAVKRQPEPFVGFFLAREEGKVPLVCAISQALVDRGWHSRDLLKPVAALLGGGGGGKPDLSTGSGKDPAAVPQALAEAEKVVRGKLGPGAT